MIYFACSGFSVPVSRYFEHLNAVEISDTELGIPGIGTTRRWLREAPEGSAFSILAPKRIVDSGFEIGKENKEALNAIKDFCKTLGACALVFTAGQDFVSNRPNRTKVRRFFESLPEGLPQPVLDLQAWTFEQMQTAVKNPDIVVAYDPLAEQPEQSGKLAYLRLSGPSGYRSRYNADAMEKIVETCNTSKTEMTFCVFRNADGFVNCRQALTALGAT